MMLGVSGTSTAFCGRLADYPDALLDNADGFGIEPASWSRRPGTPPGGTRLPHVLGDGFIERSEEVRGVDRTGELIPLDLLAHGVLHLRRSAKHRAR